MNFFFLSLLFQPKLPQVEILSASYNQLLSSSPLASTTSLVLAIYPLVIIAFFEQGRKGNPFLPTHQIFLYLFLLFFWQTPEIIIAFNF